MQPPLLTLKDIALGFGGTPLFTGVELAIQPGDRLCLVGRNGSGKSTLMKIVAGLVEADAGDRFVKPGVSVAYMEQEPDIPGATLGDWIREGLDEPWRADIAEEGLKLRPETDPAAASGGERRRAALARLIAQDPDLMLLDEPTNHLDIEAIAWLEAHLAETRKAFVTISHDRAFLKALTRATLWVDRGIVRRLDRGFDGFEDWRDRIFGEEDQARHKLDRLIKAEARWAVEGISARRKRNQGRVRRLGELRAERAGQIRRKGPAAMALEEAQPSGKLVIEARDISKAYDTPICRDFSLKVHRGDRVAIVGPNGTGKTTLLKLLLGQEAPDAGSVRHGTGLEISVFDQARAALDPALSLWETLAEDPALGVGGKNDHILVRGTPRHVVGYLKDFLFDEAQVRQPVAALSGGERARLLLARLMALPSNVLVMDEPTNDLDVETLDLIQELIDDYAGTVLLVSHDRDFLDRVATTTIALAGGHATAYAGGWSDMLAQRGTGGFTEVPAAPPPARRTKDQQAPAPKSKPKPGALTFTEAKRLDALPAEIERLEAEIAKLEELLADPDLYAREPVKFAKATEMLEDRQGKLAAAEEDWLELAERA